MPYSAKKCPAQTSSPPSRIAQVRISGHADRATEQRTGQALDVGVAEEEHRPVDRVAARLRHQPARTAPRAIGRHEQPGADGNRLERSGGRRDGKRYGKNVNYAVG